MSFISREEFAARRQEDAVGIRNDVILQNLYLNLLEKSIPYNLTSQASWMGEPILQLPQDLFAIQELIYETKPDYVIEIGTAWAGSLLYYSTLLEQFGGKGVIGVDTFIPTDLKERIRQKGKVSELISFVEGSSLEKSTVDEITRLTNGSDRIFIHLDSNHTASHVYQELCIYSKMLGVGMYLLCGDTHVELLPKKSYGDKEYDKGNNPMIGLEKFLNEDRNNIFETDVNINGKYLITLNPSGFIRKTK